MIGQTKLINTINDLIEGNKYPHYIVLEGPKGSGRSLISNYIAKQLKADIREFDNLKIDDTREIIKEVNTLAFKKLYLLKNMESTNIQSQNALLKLAEEPTDLCYIIMTVENISNLLPTLQSRAKILKMDKYTREELRNFTTREDLLNICDTPGLIQLFESCGVDDTLKFCDKIINNVSKISIMNMFTILTHIDIEGKDPKKYNRDLILEALEHKVCNLLVESRNPNYLEILRKIQGVKRNLLNNSINKQASFDDLLFTMREVLKNGRK